MAEEITLEQDIDRVLPRQQALDAGSRARWEPEPFEDQRAFASIEPEDPEEAEVQDSEDIEIDEDDEDDEDGD